MRRWDITQSFYWCRQAHPWATFSLLQLTFLKKTITTNPMVFAVFFLSFPIFTLQIHTPSRNPSPKLFSRRFFLIQVHRLLINQLAERLTPAPGAALGRFVPFQTGKSTNLQSYTIGNLKDRKRLLPQGWDSEFLLLAGTCTSSWRETLDFCPRNSWWRGDRKHKRHLGAVCQFRPLPTQKREDAITAELFSMTQDPLPHSAPAQDW